MYKFSDVKEMQLAGIIKERFDANRDQWLVPAPYANYGIFEAFFQREKPVRWDLVQWYGEFPGKLLTSLAENYRMSREKCLFDTGEFVVSQLKKAQAQDGYLGVASFDERLIGCTSKNSGSHKLWDVWAHYHCMYGLFLWYTETGNADAYEICLRAADYICCFFLDGKRDVAEADWGEMNMSAIHIFTILYQETGNIRYREMIRHFLHAWESPAGGDYINAALAGTEFWQTKKPRWESLHSIMAIGELYKFTNDDSMLTALKQIWESILKGDIHNTGGFSSGEAACGNPYDLRAVETCCTIAWSALTVDFLKLTRDPRAADELEKSTFNGIFGAQHPSGRWWTYNTPMIGHKLASAHEIVFQSHAGSPEFNCCSANSARGIGLISAWAVLSEEDRLYLNYYGGSEISTRVDEMDVKIIQNTEYPVERRVTIQVRPGGKREFALMLRIPAWSQSTEVYVNNEKQPGVTAGTYYEIRRSWNKDDQIVLLFDFSLRFLIGDERIDNKRSIYRGPLLLAYDEKYNRACIDQIPPLDFNNLSFTEVMDESEGKNFMKPWVLLKLKDSNNQDICLCDFANAGMSGTGYSTWF